MAVVNKTRTYNTDDELTAAYYNEDRDEIIAGVNSVVDAQVAVGAAIQEGKIAFSGAGHDHSGGANGAQLQAVDLEVTGLTPSQFLRVNAGGTALETAVLPVFQRGFVWFLNKVLVVENDPSVNFPIKQSMTAISLTAYVKQVPTGSGITVEVKTTSGTLIASITIAAGQFSATTTSITNPALVNGQFLRMDVTAIGSSFAGSGLTVLLDCQQ